MRHASALRSSTAAQPVDYLDFIKAKIITLPPLGLPVAANDVHPVLKPHQAALVRWAVEGGRRAIFAAFGLGKSLIQLEIMRQLRFELDAPDDGHITVTAKTVDGQFPDYARVILTEPPQRMIVDREPLAAAIKRVGVIASDKTRLVKAELARDCLRLIVTSPDIGDAVEELACDYDGPEFALGFNGVYWREALAAIASDQVVMRFDVDPKAPVLVAGCVDREDFGPLTQVLMPHAV